MNQSNLAMRYSGCQKFIWIQKGTGQTNGRKKKFHQDDYNMKIYQRPWPTECQRLET